MFSGVQELVDAVNAALAKRKAERQARKALMDPEADVLIYIVLTDIGPLKPSEVVVI